MSQKPMRTDTWCYAIKKQVWVKGAIMGKRQADLLLIVDCEESKCSERNSTECIVGKLREGQWLT